MFDSLKCADIDGSNELDFNEFLMGGIDFNVFVNYNYIKKAFNKYDIDGNGYICHKEMYALL